LPTHVRSSDLMMAFPFGREQSDGNRPLGPTIGQLLAKERWHGRIRLQPLFANAWSQLLVSLQDLNRLFKLFSRRQGLASRLSNFNFSWLGQTTINQQCAVVRIIVDRRTETARRRRRTTGFEFGCPWRNRKKAMSRFPQVLLYLSQS